MWQPGFNKLFYYISRGSFLFLTLFLINLEREVLFTNDQSGDDQHTQSRGNGNEESPPKTAQPRVRFDESW